MKKLFLLPLTFYGIFCSVLVSYSMNPNNTGQECASLVINNVKFVYVGTLEKLEEENIRIDLGKTNTNQYQLIITNINQKTNHTVGETFDELCSYYKYSESCIVLQVKNAKEYIFFCINIQDKENPIKENKICWFNENEGIICIPEENKWKFLYINSGRYKLIELLYEHVGTIHLIKKDQAIAHIKKDGKWLFILINNNSQDFENPIKAMITERELYETYSVGEMYIIYGKYGVTWIQTGENQYK